MNDTLALRAARYFGAHDKPRTGFKVGSDGYLIVTEYGGRKTILHYDESYGRGSGTFVKLTDRQRALLVAALEEPPA